MNNVFTLGAAAFVLAAVGGWIANIAKLVSMFADPVLSPMLVIRCVGVFLVPLGAVLGFF